MTSILYDYTCINDVALGGGFGLCVLLGYILGRFHECKS